MTHSFIRLAVLFILLILEIPLKAVPTTPNFSIPVSETSNNKIAKSLGKVFADVAEKVSPAVVVITVTRNQSDFEESKESSDKQSEPFEFFYKDSKKRAPFSPQDQDESQGSGFIIRPDGYIFTSTHVIQGTDKIKVRLKDGRIFNARVVGIPDEKTDVAVIKILAKRLPTVELGDSDAIRPGEWTIAIGAPFNLDYSVTVGVLSGKVRDHLGAAMYEEYLQTQATINPGNSGGPLLDIDGKVIGINTLIKTRPAPGLSFYNANVGFAIPIKLAEKIGNLLITKGKVERPWIGVEVRTLEESNEYKNVIKGVEKGVLITAIHPETPAYQSGLKPADVITSIDGTTVDTARELQRQVLDKKIGQSVHLAVVRDGVPLIVEVKTSLQSSIRQISSRPSQHRPPSNATAYGMILQPLNQELIEQFNLNEKEGLFIMDVEEDSPATRCGLIPGMVITEVNGKKVFTVSALKGALRKIDSKHGSLLQISQAGTRSFIIFYINQNPWMEGD